MRVFTAGTLFLSRDRAQVEAALKETGLPHAIRDLNGRWSVFLTEDEWHFLPDTQAAVRHVSESAPLLHYSQAEDHGWSFRLLHGGRERVAYAEHYAWDPHDSQLIGEDEPLALPPAPAKEDLVYFRLLDVLAEDVQALGHLLHGLMENRVAGFLQLLGISGMESVSYKTEAASQRRSRAGDPA